MQTSQTNRYRTGYGAAKVIKYIICISFMQKYYYNSAKQKRNTKSNMS